MTSLAHLAGMIYDLKSEVEQRSESIIVFK